jgi:hypothetical protein
MATKSTDLQERLDAIALRKAELELIETEERVQLAEGARDAKRRQNLQRQAQLRIDLMTRKAVSDKCNHRQGGSPKRQYEGTGDTALKVVMLPDGFSRLIMCSICRLRVFSPHPQDQSTNVRGKETPVQAVERVEKWLVDTAVFNDLLEKSKRSKSVEFTEPMDCGVTMQVTNGEGMPVFRRRPCDSYATA